ncbi:MAG: hypothetical protein Satyrvirus6_36 [Satyrvirus sp.]|uniref:Major capsid protein N-terminal domain-containing protein n=1 Tax=Satyrvirus sp. TaxID=2487771 RepID=A0A3G5AF36_9VIRU|nr:MAG: hypothetical protein Satyrvirus6_36 [Satyrvirus sp.]
MINYKTLYIEQYFNGRVSFNKKSKCPISHAGSSFDEFYIRVILPKLPDGYSYKKFCTYDLIKKIKITSNGVTLFKLESDFLEILDKINNNYDNVEKLCFAEKNVVYYPFNLNQIMGQEFLLERLRYYETCIYCTFSNISKLIYVQPSTNLSNSELENLDIIDSSIIVHFNMEKNGSNDTDIDVKDKIVQSISTWIFIPIWLDNTSMKNKKISVKLNSKELTNEQEYIYDILDLILCTKDRSNNYTKMIDSYSLEIENKRFFSNDLSTFHNLIYRMDNRNLEEYFLGCVVDAKDIKDSVIILNINFLEEIAEPVELLCIFKIKRKMMYYDGMVGWV